MKVMVLSSFTTSLFWFRIDMMRSFLDAGCEVVAVGDGPEGEWAPKFRELGIRYRQIYPMIAGVGSAFLGEGFKRKMLRSVLVMEYKLGLRNAKRIFFQNRDDLKVFTDNRILTEDRVVMVNGSGVNLDQFPVTKLPEKVSFLCISRLIRDKGVWEYLEAMEKMIGCPEKNAPMAKTARCIAEEKYDVKKVNLTIRKTMLSMHFSR